MGFGEYLINLVKIAFHGSFSYININGYLSQPVYLDRGLHQGSPLSPILFLLVAQVFTRKLQLNQSIKGVKVCGIDLLLSLYADDTDIFLEAAGSCLDEVVKEMNDFGLVSGCRCNLDKTKCIPLGSANSNISLLSYLTDKYGPEFLSNSFTALGVEFDNYSSSQQISDKNFENKFERAKARSRFWQTRDLTIYGKVTIIKTILMSQFVYLLTPLPRPNSKNIQILTKFIFQFLWGVKRIKSKETLLPRIVIVVGLVCSIL